MLPGCPKTLIVIVVRVAQKDCLFRVCLICCDDEFQSLFRLNWIRQRQIVQSRDATRVCRCRFQVDEISQTDARHRKSIRCQLRLGSVCLEESQFHVPECLVTRSGVFYQLP